MNVNNFPVEILHEIFRHLDGWTLLPCRAVCKRWRDAVDSMPDDGWKQICSNEYRRAEYSAVRNKYCLTWRETYRAVNSWSYFKIRRAKTSVQELCSTGVNGFKVLPKGIIACLQNNRHEQSEQLSDTIVYYNADTLQECGRQEFDFVFMTEHYDENETFILIVRSTGKLCLMLKANKKLFDVGQLVNNMCREFFLFLFYIKVSEYTLFKKEVFFKNQVDDCVYVAKLVQEGGEASISTTKLSRETFKNTILEFNLFKGKLHILTKDDKEDAEIYLYKNGNINLVKKLLKNDDNLFLELQKYGFDWRSRALLGWITSGYSICNGFCGHSNIIVTATDYEISIYFSAFIPYCCQDLLAEIEQNPTKVIDMESILTDVENDNNQWPHWKYSLDIVETGIYHKIVIRVLSKIFILCLDDRCKVKMKLRNANKPIIVKRILRKRKNPSANVAFKRHKYNTRSRKGKKIN